METKTIAIVGALMVIVAIGFASLSTPTQGTATGITGAAIADNGDYQTVKLTFENYEYKLSPSTLKKDVPVRMEVDLATVGGCMRDVVIPAFNVRKYVKAGDNIIEFTPTKSGTFNIACSMNMGRGTFDVAESDGGVADYAEVAPIPPAGGCGASGSGGCGCGGA